MNSNIETVYGWCVDHVHTAGDKTEVSVVTFENVDWVSPELQLCPHCGTKMRPLLTENGLTLECEAQCTGFINELKQIKEIKSLEKRIEALKKQVADSAIENGVKVFAKEYSSHHSEREAFDEEVLQYAN